MLVDSTFEFILKLCLIQVRSTFEELTTTFELRSSRKQGFVVAFQRYAKGGDHKLGGVQQIHNKYGSSKARKGMRAHRAPG